MAGLGSLAGLGGMGGMGGMGGLGNDAPTPDTSETVHISALALLKMLKHARAGVPMEVMGLMLGEVVDAYSVRVIDVYSMPQSGNTVSVEAVDPVFQQKMLEMLGQVGRSEMCVGWYHSHPGFGCWLSSVDVNTAQSFEQSTVDGRSVSVVVDPIQSVAGKVVLSAFRTINYNQTMMTGEPRQTTSNIGWLERPSQAATMRGLNRTYYQLPCAYRKNENEVRMLLKVYNKGWENGIALQDPIELQKENLNSLSTIKNLCKEYEKMVTGGLDADEVANVGKINSKVRIENEVESLLSRNVNQVLSTMIASVVF